jgi:hypothetical protein
MSRIIDLHGDDGTHEILKTLSLDGLIREGKLLATRPLATYLEDSEEPRYGLRNKKSGVEISGPDRSERLSPDDEYQAVTLVTDLRVLFVIGRAVGDEVKEVPLTEIIEAKADSGRFRRSTLRLETLDEKTWEFACKSDTEPVASYVDEAAHIWANAQRLLDEVEDQIAAGRECLETDEPGKGHGELAGAQGKVDTALQRIREVGPAASERVESRGRRLSEELSAVKREVFAAEGANAHAEAQEAWENAEYEPSSESYESAVQAYERALESNGPVPSDEALRRRIRGVVGERELLRVGPLLDADTARRRAADTDDPEAAATEWERALDGYRELLSLDWGRDQRHFLVNRDRIREQTAAIADDAIEDHHEAGRRWLRSGDKLATQGQEREAMKVYRRAKNQFEQAHRLAREVKPEHVEKLESALVTVEDRLSGAMPDEVPEEPPLSASDIREIQATDDGRSRDTDRDSTGESVSTVEQEGGGNEEESRPGEEAPPDDDESRPGEDLETEDESSTDEEKSRPERADSTRGDADTGPDVGTVTPAESVDGDGRPGDDGAGMAGESGKREGDGELDGRLSRLGEAEFENLVADLWEAQGWSTTRVSAAAGSVYDVIAMREEPLEERLLVWTIHRPGDEVTADEVKGCATARESSQGADTAVVVTTGTPTASAAESADDLDVAIVDSDELGQLLEFEGLTDRL